MDLTLLVQESVISFFVGGGGILFHFTYQWEDVYPGRNPPPPTPSMLLPNSCCVCVRYVFSLSLQGFIKPETIIVFFGPDMNTKMDVVI